MSPSAFTNPPVKKYFNSKIPLGVCAYL